MFDEIKILIQQIKQCEHMHKVTIFNKQKNNQNLHFKNLTQGKLIQTLKKLQYFNQQNQHLGSQYLLCVIQFIQSYFLRKDKIFINLKESNLPNEFILIQGVLKWFQLKISNQDKSKNTQAKRQSTQTKRNLVENGQKKFSFYKYLSNGVHINFCDFRQQQNQLISHTNCELLKIPNKQLVDINIWMKKVTQLQVKLQKSQNLSLIKQSLKHLISHQRLIHPNIEPDMMFGLGNYDFNQLLSYAKIQTIQRNQIVFYENQEINRIGLIQKGKIIVQQKKFTKAKFVSITDAIVTMYKRNFKHQQNITQKSQTILEFGQWIGLQDYLHFAQNHPFKAEQLNSFHDQNQLQIDDSIFLQLKKKTYFQSSKQIKVLEKCKILWIPIQIFAQKFNYQTNFQTLQKWSAIYSLKNKIKQKNDDLNEKITKQNDQAKNLQVQLPKLSHKLISLGHNIEQVEQKMQLRCNLFATKQKRNLEQPLRKKYIISQTSLLGVTLKQNINQYSTVKDESNNLFKERNFSKLSKNLGIKNQSTLIKNNQQSSYLQTRKSNSEHNITPIFSLGSHLRHQSPQNLVMYPEAYQPSKLPPDLRKQLILAQKFRKFDQSDYNHPHRHRSVCLQQSRIVFQKSLQISKKSIQTSSKIIQGQKKSIEVSRDNDLNKSKISSLKSMASANLSMISNNPEQIYQKIVQKISFKFPNLQQKLRNEKQILRRTKQFKKVSIKQKIQQMKILQENARKKRQKQRIRLFQAQGNSKHINQTLQQKYYLY